MQVRMVAAESFLARHDDALVAIVTLVIAALAIVLVERTVGGRERKIAAVLSAPPLGVVTDTRLRFLRRAINAFIVIVALGIVIAQFTTLDAIAGTVLASGAIVAAIVGFAARQVLANAIAGVVLAITQPVRLGDLVTFEGQTGVVEDVTLTYTWLRTESDARIVVPNERLAAGVLRNDSIRSPTVELEVSVWLRAGEDERRALETLRGLPDVVEARIADVTESSVRISLAGDAVPPSQRLEREATLRERALAALRDAGVRGNAG